MKRITLFATALLCTAVLMAQTTDPIIRSCSEEYYEYGTDGWIKMITLQKTYDTAGNLYQQIKNEDGGSERRTYTHDAEGRQTSVIVEYGSEDWGEYQPSEKIVKSYDPIAKDFNVEHAKYTWDQVEQDWVMTDGSNFRDVERNADGNITSIIIKSYFTHVAAIVPHTKTTITYGADGKADSYSIQSASDHNATTGVTTWGRANTYKNIQWQDTDGQLYQDVNTMLIGPNRMKYAELYKGSTHAGTLKVTYVEGKPDFEAVIDYTVGTKKKEIHSYVSLDDNGSYREQFVIHNDGDENGEITEKEISTEYAERKCDEHGNELSFERYYDGELGAGNRFTYTYDADGNLTEMIGEDWTPTYNSIGQLISGEYTYGHRIVYGDYQNVNTSIATALPNDGTLLVYNLHGTLVATSTDNLPAGIYVVRQGGKTFKLMR